MKRVRQSFFLKYGKILHLMCQLPVWGYQGETIMIMGWCKKYEGGTNDGEGEDREGIDGEDPGQ